MDFQSSAHKPVSEQSRNSSKTFQGDTLILQAVLTQQFSKLALKLPKCLKLSVSVCTRPYFSLNSSSDLPGILGQHSRPGHWRFPACHVDIKSNHCSSLDYDHLLIMLSSCKKLKCTQLVALHFSPMSCKLIQADP